MINRIGFSTGGPDYLLSRRRSRRRPPVASGKLVLCGLLFLAGPILRAEPVAPDLTAEALPILQANYGGPKKLPLKEGEHLGDLIAKSDGTICLCAPENDSVPTPMVTAFLPGNIIYWRLASFTPETGWPGLATQLDQWIAQGTEGVVLDLRSNLAPDDYAGAAQAAGFFVPPGTPLFASRNASGDNHIFTGMHQGTPFHCPVVLITDKETAGAAEALAACLKDRGALVIGHATMGKAAIFTEEKLSSGRSLRYVSAQISLPNGMELWSHPVAPDIGLTLDEPNEKSALALIGQHRVLDVICEVARRHRMSEAFLVQGENPELDDYLTSREKKTDASTAGKPAVQDIALIDALDSLKAIRWSQRWTASASGTAPPTESSSVQ